MTPASISIHSTIAPNQINTPYPTYTFVVFPTQEDTQSPPTISLVTQAPPIQPTAGITKQKPPTKTNPVPPSGTPTEVIVLPPGGGSWGVSTTADLVNIPNNHLICTATVHPYNATPVYAIAANSPINLNLGVGQAETYYTGITVNGTVAWYQVTCHIQANFNDPTAVNDRYSESFPPPP